MIRYTCLAGVGVFVSLSFQSVAQTQSPLDALYACSEIESDSERLACYDGAVGRTKEAETAGEFRTITRQEADEVQKDAFGFSMPSLPKFSLPSLGGDDDGVKKNDDGEIDELTLAIANISEGAYGKVVIEFENGQVWRQSDTTSVRISRKRPPESAVIKRAGLGSFLIRLSTGERFKAKREQ